MEYFLIAIMAISAILIPTASGIPQTEYKGYIGLFAAVSMLVWWLWKHNRFLAIFFAWVIIRTILPHTQPRAMINISNISIGVMIYLALQYININKDRLYKAIIILTSAQILTVFIQKSNLFMFWNSSETGIDLAVGSVYGLFGNSNFSGAFIAMTLPVFLYFKKYIKFGWMGILLGLLSLLMLDCQFAIIAALGALSFYLYIENRDFIIKRRIHYFILSFITTSALLIAKFPLYIPDGRWEVWNQCLALSTFNGAKEWGCHFVQGFGLGSTFLNLPRITQNCALRNIAWFQVHNDYLQMLLELGVIGLLIILALILNTFRKFSKDRLVEYACFTALIIDAFGFFIMRTSPMGFMGVMFLGLIDRRI